MNRLLVACTIVAAMCAGCSGTKMQTADGPMVTMSSTLKFHPAELTIDAGQTVTWHNKAIMTHTVTADPAKAKNPADASLPPGAQPFDSGPIKAGSTFQHTFTVPGTYKYFCKPHEGEAMKGTIIVKPAAAKPPPG